MKHECQNCGAPLPQSTYVVVECAYCKSKMFNKHLQPITVETHGGAIVGGGVSTGGGDYTGRDKIVHGDEIRGDKVGGSKVTRIIRW